MVSSTGTDQPSHGGAEWRASPDRQPAREHDVSRPRLNLGKLSKANPKDYAIRFVLGGVVSVVASLLGHWVTQRFGGIFTAFPAILLASLTLIGEHDGNEASAEDAAGGVAGALALVVLAVFLSLVLPRASGALALAAGVGLWLVLAVSLYGLAVRFGWLRTRARDDGENPDDRKAAPSRSH